MAQGSTPVSLRQLIRPTVLINASSLYPSTSTTIATETYQRTGSVKFRAACSIVEHTQADSFITVSSGNFGSALAHACKLVNKKCIVVMSRSASKTKIDAVLNEGGRVEFASSAAEEEAAIVASIRRLTSIQPIRAKENSLAIDGYATLGKELAAADCPFDIVVVPIGGGGVISGIIKGLRTSGKVTQVIGVEPANANDAAQSLRSGTLVSLNSEPETLADGARALSLGVSCWNIIRQEVSNIVEVSEEAIEEAMRVAFNHFMIKAEPTGALGIAAILSRPSLFQGASVCCVVTGGNVDNEMFVKVLTKNV